MLRDQLNELARRGERQRFRHALNHAAVVAVAWSPLALGLGPLGVVVAKASHSLRGLTPPAPSWAQLGGLLLVGPVAFILLATLRAAWRHRPDRAAALALFDRGFSPGDRLRTADEFLHSLRLTEDNVEAGFMRAAILDASEALRAALIAPTPLLPRASFSLRRHSAWGPLAAFALLLLIHGWPIPATFSPDSNRPEPAPAIGAVAAPKKSPTPSPTPVAAPTPPAPRDSGPAEPAPRLTGKNSMHDDRPPASSPASGGAASSSATESTSSSTGTSDPRRAPTTPPEPATPPPATAKATPRQQPAKSGAAALAAQANSGQGHAPSPSDPSPNPNEPPQTSDRTGTLALRDENEEARREEDESEKSDGVAMPMRNEQLRDVSRTLGNQPPGDPDENSLPNGRGGPGDLKKSRGVPTMLLGIPVPDRVPGTPGPGRTKVSQEQARPTAQASDAAEARVPQARTGPIGALQSPELLPWRRRLLQRYFQPTSAAPAIQP